MIESRSQTGQWRRMIPSQSSPQPVESSHSGTDTETKRIVSHRGSASGSDPPRSSPEAEPRLLKKNPTERNITSYSQPRSLGSAYWPVISLNSSFENERPCALESRRGWRLKANLYREQSVPPQSGWKHATWRWPRKDSCVRSPLSVAVNALVQRWFRRLQRGAGSIVLYR